LEDAEAQKGSVKHSAGESVVDSEPEKPMNQKVWGAAAEPTAKERKKTTYTAGTE
jgi:hypothetical protein